MDSIFSKFLFLLVFTSLISCDNDNEEVIIFQEEDGGFYNLQIGNKWQYQYFQIDKNGSITDTLAFEEIEVIDKLMLANNDEEYYRLKVSTQSFQGNSCPPCEDEPTIFRNVRDSLGYLINDDGFILYSSENETPYLYAENEWGDIFIQLQESDTIISVPSGNFSTKNNMWYAIRPTGDLYDGRSYDYYSEGVGQIKYSIGTTNNLRIVIEKVLTNYDFGEE